MLPIFRSSRFTTLGDSGVSDDSLARKHPVDRLFACLLGWLVILTWVAIVAATGVPLFLSTVTSRLDVVAMNVIAAAALVVPVTGTLAAMESRSRQATIGKRFRRLHVVDNVTEHPVSFGRALVRNGLNLFYCHRLTHVCFPTSAALKHFLGTPHR